ncbi:MAG: hypothetical protein HGA19_03665 [Oscillochloris sp.]|nr:hypothetical protein [Oscillochloris sp.]
MSDPSLQPDREEQIRQILAYLEQHRSQYELTVLRKQLLDTGYSNTVVDEALRRLAGGKPDRVGFGVRLLGVPLAVLNFALLGLLIYGAAALSNDLLVVLFSALGLLIVELAVAGATWNRPGRERLSRLLLWTVIWTVVGIAILIALGALLVGICLSMFNGF